MVNLFVDAYLKPGLFMEIILLMNELSLAF